MAFPAQSCLSISETSTRRPLARRHDPGPVMTASEAVAVVAADLGLAVAGATRVREFLPAASMIVSLLS